MHTIVDAFEAIAVRHRHRIALEEETQSVTYGELDSWSDAVAAALSDLGITPGAYVPIAMGRCAAYAAAALAVLKCQAAYVPLDPNWPASRSNHIIQQTQAKVCLVAADPKPREQLACAYCDVDGLRLPGTAGDHDLRAAPVPGDSNRCAYVMYTSGSTGQPKGSRIPHCGVLRLVVGADFAEMGLDRRWALLSSVAFDASTLELWAPLLNGATCVVFRDDPSVDAVADFLRNRRITSCWLTAGLFNLLVDYRLDSFDGVGQVLTGGDTASKRHMARFVRAHPRNRLIHGYGPTENTTFTLCHTVRDSDVASERRIPIGRPINGTVVRIVDHTGNECGDDETGELLAGGAGVALGYLSQQQLTAERFIEIDGRRWYRTGDLVSRRSTGEIEFVGRVDRQVKIQGHRIEPEEIELAMMSCPGVVSAAVEVDGVEADEKLLVGYYAAQAGCKCDAQELRSNLAQRLPQYAIPARLVPVEDMPLSTTGKIDRTRLRDRTRATPQLPDLAEAPKRNRHSTTQDQLSAVWRELLSIDQVAWDSDFFELGGHSLLVMRLIAELRRRFNVPIEPAAIYRNSRFGDLVKLVDRTNTVAPVVHSAAAPSKCSTIERLLFAAAESGGEISRRAYNEFFAFVVEGPFDYNRFGKALRGIIAEHAVLRSNYRISGDGSLQRIVRPPPEQRDVCHEGSEAAFEATGKPNWHGVMAAVDSAVDPGRDLLVSSYWFPAGDRSLLVLRLHHLIVDEWSLNLLLQLLCQRSQEGCAASDAGSSNELSYGHFVAFDEEHADIERAGELGRCLAAGSSNLAVLPHAPAPGVEYDFRPSRAAIEAIEACAARNHCSVFAVWLTLLAEVVERRLGQQDVWIRTPFSARRDPALQNLLGCCIDMRLINASRGPAKSLDEHVQRVWEQVLAEQNSAIVPLDAAMVEARLAGRSDAPGAGAVALVFRREMGMPINLAGARATPIHVPVALSKFALCLHVEAWPDGWRLRLEGARPSFTFQSLETLARELEAIATTRDQQGTGSMPSMSAALAPQPVADDGQVPDDLRQCLEDIWAQASPPSAGTVQADVFYGTSLAMMRMVAEIRRQTGKAVDIPAFLQRPTRSNLISCLREPANDGSVTIARFGPERARLSILALTGAGGSALSWYWVWRRLSAQFGQAISMICPDMAEIEARLSFSEAANQLTLRVREALPGGGDLAIAGYSAGGPLAVELAARLASTCRIQRLWLIDAFAPRLMLPATTTKLAHAVLLAGFRPKGLLEVLRARNMERKSADAELRKHTPNSRRRGSAFYRELRTWALPCVSVNYTFIQSSQRSTYLGHIWVGRLNGLAGVLRGSGDLRRVDAPHGRMLVAGAEALSRIFADDIAPMRSLERISSIGGSD